MLDNDYAGRTGIVKTLGKVPPSDITETKDHPIDRK